MEELIKKLNLIQKLSKLMQKIPSEHGFFSGYEVEWDF